MNTNPDHPADCECDVCMPPCPVCGSKYTEQNQDGTWICLPCTDTTDLSPIAAALTAAGASSDPIATTIGRTFVELLRKELSADDWREMLRRNASAAYRTAGNCASHDFTDANMVMAEACEQHGVTVDPTSDAGVAIWNAAWTAATPLLTAATRGEEQ